MPNKILDLRTQLRFYKYYHCDKINVLIHAVFVPTILFSSCCILHRVPVYQNITITHLFSSGFAIFYCLLYFPTGLLAALILSLVNVSLDKKWINLSLKQELTLFITGWICQFIGHGVFEGKKPALLDNLMQSLVLAPYFILFELLFKLGFMPILHDQLDRDIRRLRANKPLE